MPRSRKWPPHHEALLRLALAADFRDTDTGNHIVRIGYLSEALALLLGLSSEAAAMLRKAAPMHDIGKIGVPDAVLKKPGPLDPEERRQMNEHAAIGAHILGRSRIPCSRWPPRWPRPTTNAGTAAAIRQACPAGPFPSPAASSRWPTTSTR
jgi:hypothetical protein